MRTASHASRSGARAGIWPPVRQDCLALLIAGPSAIAVAQNGASLGATVDGLLAAGRQLSPSLRAAALETAATMAKAEGADALDDPTLVDNYQYYHDPGVFSGHAIMVTQAFPLWGKRDLRKQAALADVEAARGREQAAQNELDERIKVAFARYYVAVGALAVDREVIALTESMRRAAAARYGAGRGDQPAVLQALGEETTARTDVARLEGDRETARAQLNALPARAPGGDWARLKAARQTEDLLDREALPQARAAQKSPAAGYSRGRGDLAAAIDAGHRVHALELKLLQAQLDGQVALAAIERLVGGDL